MGDEQHEDDDGDFWSEDDDVPLYRRKTYENMNDDVDDLPVPKRLRGTNVENDEQAVADD